MKESLKQPVRTVMELVAAGRYRDLARMTGGVRLGEEEMAAAVRDYGRTITRPPDEGYDLMDVIEVRGSNPRQWSVTMPFWTVEEGRSDLSLELTLLQSDDGFRVEIDNIHVL